MVAMGILSSSMQSRLEEDTKLMKPTILPSSKYQPPILQGLKCGKSFRKHVPKHETVPPVVLGFFPSFVRSFFQECPRVLLPCDVLCMGLTMFNASLLHYLPWGAGHVVGVLTPRANPSTKSQNWFKGSSRNVVY